MGFREHMRGVMAEARSVRDSLTFGQEGDSVGPEKGYKLIRERGQRWNEMVVEMGGLMADVMEGKRPDWHLKEAMTTSDFPLLFGDLLYRQLQGNYRAFPSTISKWCSTRTVRDFRAVNLYTIDGGNGLLDQVAQRAPYPETTFTEGKKAIQVYKYGRRYSITFEMLINDDLQAFNDRPRFMAQAVRNSEEYAGTQMIADVNGPHASFFTAGNANIVTGNPALSIVGLQTAYKVLSAMTDSEGMPISVNGVILMVVPSLEITAMNIMNAVNLDIRGESGGGTSEQFLNVQNWMRGRVQLVVNHFLPIVSTSETTDNWFLIASPGESRPAFHFARLRGHESPELYVKDSNQLSLGGGMVDPAQGSFENDDIDYKLRAFFGTLQGDPKMAVASNGSGS